jgi:methionyl-tRNA formyltransferase
MQWALIRGEKETGVSLFQIEKGLDTGPVYLQRATPLLPDDNVVTLRDRLVSLGLDLLDEFLRKKKRGLGCPFLKRELPPWPRR